MTWMLIVWDVFALVYWVRIFWKAAARPPSKYDLGWVGKIATIAVILLGTTAVFGAILPIGAFVIAWRERSHYEVPDIPLAEGWPGSDMA